jgi:hypothetical protein
MRLTPSSLSLFLCLLITSLQAWSQTGKAEPAPTPPPAPKAAVEPRTERIVVEDSSARIDELRVGGQTKQIDVKPKGGMPAYQVHPESGERTWKVLGF